MTDTSSPFTFEKGHTIYRSDLELMDHSVQSSFQTGNFDWRL